MRQEFADSPAGPPPPEIPGKHGNKRRWFRRWPLLAVALLLAALVTARSGLKHYQLHAELRDTGSAVSKRTVLDRLALPGIVPFYVVGTITRSLAAGWVAFVVAMAAAYGAVGVLADVLVKLLRRAVASPANAAGRAGG